MEEEPEGLAQPHAPQLAADGHQMEVVHPNDVVGPQQPGQVSGEHLVHPQVALIVFAVVRREVGPVVKQGPQRAVGEAVVVFRAGLGGRGITGDRDAVGDHDDSAHRTVSQLRVSRMAELISPTSE